MSELLNALIFILWALCWIIGGWWIVHSAFHLNPNEESFIGFVVGLAAEVGLVNFAARVMTLPWAIWLSAIAVLLTGLILSMVHGGLPALKIKINLKQWLIFFVLTYVFFLISRGWAIWDDYAHLPTLSIMATGQIPPHFSYDPQATYGYHYFVLLFGAQIMRLTGWQPWTAWDVARTLTMAPAIILGGLWAYRVTRNQLAGVVGGAAVLFVSGTRWLLLFIPNTILTWMSSHVQLIGSGTATGPSLLKSLANPWLFDGQGSFPFPFAFANGVYPSGAEAVLNPLGLMLVAVLFALLLTSTRWKNAWGGVVSIILVSSIGLLNEVALPFLALAMVILTVVWMIRQRSARLPSELKHWWLVWLVSGVIVALQGGVWTTFLAGVFNHLLGNPVQASYFSIQFQLASPSIVSAQLGVLSLLNVSQLLVALIEVGPILLVLPLLAWWAWKAARAERWYEATFSGSAVLSLVMIFVHFTGSTGIGNGARLYFFIPICAMMAVSMVWLWAAHKKKLIQGIIGILGGVVMFGGIVMLGVQMPSIKNEVDSYFITPPDARMESRYWNRLDPGALVFDPIPSRGATIFGRYTNAGFSWYTLKPSFENLVTTPDVYRMHSAGFSYAYIDQTYWENLSESQKLLFSQSCTNLIHEEKLGTFWRRLYDIRSCNK
jgi:hypothetical protein